MRKIKLTILVLVALLLVACSEESAGDEGNKSNGETGDTIKIGVVTSLTGAYSPIGTEVVEGIEFAAEEVNEAGGVLGKQVEVVIEDSEGAPDVGLRKAERLANKEDVNIIMGSVSSAVGLAIGARMPEWDGIYISTVNKTPKLTTDDWNEHIFRANHNDLQDMETIEAWYEENGKGNSWYMIGSDYEWGHSSLSGFKEIAEANGDQIVGEAFTELGTTDFSSQITNMLAAKPDGVWVALSGSDGINFVSQAKSFGLMDEMEVVTFITDVVVETTGTDSLGVLGNVNYHYSIDNDVNNEFVKNFEMKFDKKPTNYHGESYAAAQMLFKGIEEANSTETKNLIQSMKNMTFESVWGEVTVRAEDHQLLHPNYMGKIVESDDGVTVEITYTSTIEEANPPLE